MKRINDTLSKVHHYNMSILFMSGISHEDTFRTQIETIKEECKVKFHVMANSNSVSRDDYKQDRGILSA